MDQIAAKAFVTWAEYGEDKRDVENHTIPLLYLIALDGK